jgi:hypothetical protein
VASFLSAIKARRPQGRPALVHPSSYVRGTLADPYLPGESTADLAELGVRWERPPTEVRAGIMLMARSTAHEGR